MRLRCCDFSEFARQVQRAGSKIVVFGAGVIGTVTVPEILHQYQLQDQVVCYLDNNRREPTPTIDIGTRRVMVEPVEWLAGAGENIVILVAISRYAEALEQLGRMSCTKNMPCFLMPMMCIHNFCSGVSRGEPVLSDKPRIPKTIHYMWLGKKPLPPNLQQCIDSWQRYCPDYEVVRWDESNYDIAKHAYMRDAYERGAYGFVPDYARLDILYQYGGIYMDTDVEVIKSLDPLLYQEAFCGVEKWQVVNFGGGSGAVKGHWMIGEFLKAREAVSFLDQNGRPNPITCGFYDTRTALKNGYRMDGTTQNIEGMNLYAYDYFHPYDYMSGHTNLTKHTYAIHRFHGGWLDEKMKRANEKATSRYEQLYRLSTEK